MKIIAIIHARMKSSRLPGKALKMLKGKSVFYRHYERMKEVKGVSEIWLATTKDPSDDSLVAEAEKYGIPFYRGADEDLLERYNTIADKTGAVAVVRCGCDKPLFSYEIVDKLLSEYKGEDVLSASTPLPAGLGSEIISARALKEIYKHYHGPAITKYVYEYPHKFEVRKIEVDNKFSRPEFRLSLDTKEDYKVMKTLYERLYNGRSIDTYEALKFLDDNPDISNINRNVGVKNINSYVKHLAVEPIFTVYRADNGEYLVKNRMGEKISAAELISALSPPAFSDRVGNRRGRRRQGAYGEVGFVRRNINKIKAIGFNLPYYIYRLKWNLIGYYPVLTKVPLHVDLELSSYCNLKCVMCPHSIEGKTELNKGFMPKDMALAVLREAKEIGVSSVKFSGRGEVTMHPDFKEILTYAKRLGFLDVMFNTNGLLLNKELAEAVVDNKVNFAIISLDGALKETYEKIRVGGDYDKVVENISYLLEYKKKKKSRFPIVRLQFVKMKENINEFEKFKRDWEKRVDVLVGIDYTDRINDKDKSVVETEYIGRAYCPHPWRRLTVTSDGKVLMCCVDWECKYPVGDIRAGDKLVDIWKSKKITYARKMIRSLNHDKIPSCKVCFSPISYLRSSRSSTVDRAGNESEALFPARSEVSRRSDIK